MSEPNPKMVILYVVWGEFSHKYDNSVRLKEIKSEQLQQYRRSNHSTYNISVAHVALVAQIFFG